jgi:hypothetical protein
MSWRQTPRSRGKPHQDGESCDMPAMPTPSMHIIPQERAARKWVPPKPQASNPPVCYEARRQGFGSREETGCGFPSAIHARRHRVGYPRTAVVATTSAHGPSHRLRTWSTGLTEPHRLYLLVILSLNVASRPPPFWFFPPEYRCGCFCLGCWVGGRLSFTPLDPAPAAARVHATAGSPAAAPFP